MNNNLNINAVEIVKKKPECFHLRAMHTFLFILPSSNIFLKLPNLLTCGDKALTSPTKHWYSTFHIAWLPSFVGLHNGTKLRRGCSFSVNQFFHNGIWWFVTTTQRLIPIWNPFSVSRTPLNQLKQCIHLKIGLMLKTKSVIGGICHFDWVKGIYCFTLWNGGEHSWNCYTFRFIAIPFLATVLL